MSTRRSLAIALLFVVAYGRDDLRYLVADPIPASESRAHAAPPPTNLGSGWGTLKGTIQFRGALPEPREITNEKDPLGPRTIVDDSLVVDPQTFGLANVLIYARNVARVSPEYDDVAGKDIELRNADCRFAPRVVASTLKDKFIISSSDRAGHNPTGTPPSANVAFNQRLQAGDRRFVYPGFKRPTLYPYEIRCTLHPWEKAWHIVRPAPYFAVTATDGTFQIERLPAGVELEFQVWHERANGDRGGLIALPNWRDGRFKLRIPQDGETVTMDVDVYPRLFTK